MQKLCPSKLLKVPALHGSHVVALEAPIAAEAVPAGHTRHAAAPLLSMNVPAGHGAHSVLPKAAEKRPTLQFWHASSTPTPPSRTPNVPFGQALTHVA